jgi:hypothetical protein
VKAQIGCAIHFAETVTPGLGPAHPSSFTLANKMDCWIKLDNDARLADDSFR